MNFYKLGNPTEKWAGEMNRHWTKTMVKEVINLEVSTIAFEEVGGDSNLEEAQDKYQGYWKYSISLPVWGVMWAFTVW